MVSSIDVCLGCQLTDGTDWARLELSIVTDGRVSPVVFKPGEKNDVNFFATEVIIYCDAQANSPSLSPKLASETRPMRTSRQTNGHTQQDHL